jgi:hypothetical protein
MNRDLWRYELRRIGWPALVGPPFAVAAMGFFGLLANALGNPQQVNRILSSTLDVLPLVAGIAAAHAVSGDRAIELQLSLPMTFRRTALRRLALAVGWTALLSLAVASALAASHRLVWPTTFWGEQLVWLIPVAWLTAVGATLTLGLRGAAIGSGLVAVIWAAEAGMAGIFQQSSALAAIWLFARYSPEQSVSWFWNRALLSLVSLALFATLLWLLGKTDWLLGRES